ncbi:MAG: permease [Thermoplasmatota archaeon]
MSEKGKRGRSMLRSGLVFLAIVAGLYLVSYTADGNATWRALQTSMDILYDILPVLSLVIAMMTLVNYLLKPKQVAIHLGAGSGTKGWLLASLAGIVSHGPIYIWYPLLQELQDKGMRPGLSATFLYNRAVKIPLLPVMIYYFGVTYVAVLMATMVGASLAEGKLIDLALTEA